MDKRSPSQRLPELWGGLECTINRVNDSFRDQLHDTGHYTRPDDIVAFGKLGIRKLRYPVLWEKHQPSEHTSVNWEWATAQLEQIIQAGMDPIVTLLHHGSGPEFTNLLDPDFPEKFALYAGMVARQFPAVHYYTPVNEPLTTARFSGLYGIWYPHYRDELSFVKMLLNELKGIVLSMQAIRAINPQAKLVQTEDLAKTHSTPLLEYQARFENTRRWLTYDLLCGKVDFRHFFWKHFISLGISERELLYFLDNPCPPDLMGFNYYVTSERYLDENFGNYPPSTIGGNGKQIYADVESVRTIGNEGIGRLLKEAWQRYQIPMAITECHLSCTREEQLRWYDETWNKACQLIKEGVEIKAITAWALLGAYDWNSLLSNHSGHYESGAFDVRNGNRRATALTKLMSSLATTGKYDHPLLKLNGWWHKSAGGTATAKKVGNIPFILITGKNGTLGQAFMRICDRRSIPYIATSHEELDIANEKDIKKAIDNFHPYAIINAAGYVNVDQAEINAGECFKINAIAPGLLANISRQKGVRLVTFSSDLVFDGAKMIPYDESDTMNPINIYGASKAAGERAVLIANPSALVIRTSAFFGPWDRYNFAYEIIAALKDHKQMLVADDVTVSPTYVPDLVDISLDLLIDEEDGIWHLTNQGASTWADFAQEIAQRAGFKKELLDFRPSNEMPWRAKRPLYSALQSEKGVQLPQLARSLDRFFLEQAV